MDNNDREWIEFIEKNKRVCSKCGLKDSKVFMDEVDGIFICKTELFCRNRSERLSD